MKRKLKLFGIAFFCTLLLVGLLCGFALADNNTRQTGYGDFVPLLEAGASETPLVYEVAVMGTRYRLSLEWLNPVASLAQRASPYAPAKLRVAAKLAALANQRLVNLFF